jgi:hypothetical protein
MKALFAISSMPAPSLSAESARALSAAFVAFLERCLRKSGALRALPADLLRDEWLCDVVSAVQKGRGVACLQRLYEEKSRHVKC